MSVMRASRKPVSSNTCWAASIKRARVRAPLDERGPFAFSLCSCAAADDDNPISSTGAMYLGAPADRCGLDGDRHVHQLREVPAHDLAYELVGQVREVVDEAGGVGETLGMRVVGPEPHVV